MLQALAGISDTPRGRILDADVYPNRFIAINKSSYQLAWELHHAARRGNAVPIAPLR